MRDILELFTDPEVCTEEMIWGNRRQSIGKAILTIAQEALLIGLIGAIGLKTSLPYLIEMLANFNSGAANQLNKFSNTHFGILLLCLGLGAAVIIIISAVLKALVMAVLLFIMRFFIGGKAPFKTILLITIYSQVIAVSLLLIGAVCMMIVMITTDSVVTDVVLGLVMLFQYWYLIFTAVGFKTANRVSTIKGIAAVLLMQCVFWGMQYALLSGNILF